MKFSGRTILTTWALICMMLGVGVSLLGQIVLTHENCAPIADSQFDMISCDHVSTWNGLDQVWDFSLADSTGFHQFPVTDTVPIPGPYLDEEWVESQELYHPDLRNPNSGFMATNTDSASWDDEVRFGYCVEGVGTFKLDFPVEYGWNAGPIGYGWYACSEGHQGTSTITASGVGTLILPWGAIDDVVKIEILEEDSGYHANGLDEYTLTTRTVDYFIKPGVKFPVAFSFDFSGWFYPDIGEDPTYQSNSWSRFMTESSYNSNALVGCMDPAACNYSSEFVYDDGNCCFGSCGCADQLACNYNPTADCLVESTCLYLDNCGDCGGAGILGCIDPVACNFSSNASCDDGSCLFYDGCGDCGGTAIAGCQDESACNFNPEATCDGEPCLSFDECGVCGGVGLSGCTNPQACNYAAWANCDDGSCDFLEVGEESIPGCTYVGACNFDPNATCNNMSCLWSVNVELMLPEGFEDFVLLEVSHEGDLLIDHIFLPGQSNSHMLCLAPLCYEFQISTFGEQEIAWQVITPEYILNSTVSESELVQLLPLYDYNCVVLGCTDSDSCNYDSEANWDDGSCTCLGDVNGDGSINVSDLLDFLADWNCTFECAGDSNGDGIVNTIDLLELLSFFGG